MQEPDEARGMLISLSYTIYIKVNEKHNEISEGAKGYFYPRAKHEV